MFNWGRGDYGVFGNGYNKSLLCPIKNDYFELIKKEDKLIVEKMKSCNNYTVALFSN